MFSSTHSLESIKKVFLLGVIALLLISSFIFPREAAAQRHPGGAGSGVICIGTDGARITLRTRDLCDILFGPGSLSNICSGITIDELCRRNGYAGAYGGAVPFIPPPPGGPVQGLSQFATLLLDILGWAQIFFWILAAGFGLYAAYLYLFSGGDTGKLETAKKTLIYMVVAIIVAVVAYSIPNLVASFLGA